MAHGENDIFIAEGLGQIVVSPRADRANGIVAFAVRRHHNHGNRFIVRFDPCEDFKAVHVRQTDIQQDHFRRLLPDSGERLLPARCLNRRKSRQSD